MAPVNTTSTTGVTESALSGVSWSAVIGGAVVGSAASLILLVLGTGVGLSSVSPFANSGASGTGFTVGAAVWLIIVQIISAGLGGYIAGRLRTRWTTVHTDEVYFRDTAHGLMVWAVGVLVSASILASATTAVLGTATQAAGSVASGIGSTVTSAAGGATNAAANNPGDVQAYFDDMLFRSDKPPADPNAPGVTQEVGRIMARSIASGTIAPADKAYTAQLISARTGLSQADAEKRVDDTMAQAKAAADKAEQTARDAAEKARKAGAYLSLWLFVSMLVGAFASSLAATWGGRARDAAHIGR